MAIKNLDEWYLEIAEVMEMEQLSRREVYQRCKDYRLLSIQRREIDPGTPGQAARRGILVPAKALSPAAKERWQKRLLQQLVMPTLPASSSPAPTSQTQTAEPTSISTPTVAASAAVPQQLPLTPPTNLDLRIAAIPPGPQKQVMLTRFRAVQPLFNEDWRTVAVSKSAYVREVAAQLKVTQKTIWQWRAELAKTMTPECPEGDPGALAPQRPGPESLGPGSRALDLSTRLFIRVKWEADKLSRAQTVAAVKGYLTGKQRGAGAAHYYDELSSGFPLETSIRRFINETLHGDDDPWRAGDEAVKEWCGSIPRTYDDEFAGTAWCVDEWELDGVFYDARKHSQLINYGARNPIAHLVSIIDERTTRILTWILTLHLDSEAVLDLFERGTREHGVPKFLVRDKGGVYRARLGGRVVMRRGGELIEQVSGALGALGVTLRTPRKEKNPRGNRIERMHLIYAAKARRDFGLSWRGANTTEREMTDIDARVKKHLVEHCRLGTCGPQLLSIQEVQSLVEKWVEEINLAPTEAKGCAGMTRLAAFRQFQPPEEERARRRVSDRVLTVVFAEHFLDRTIRQGMVELPDGKRYYSPELLLFNGELREAVRPRHDHSFIWLWADQKGPEPIVAERQVPVGTADPQALARASEHLAAVRKIAAEMGAGREKSEARSQKSERRTQEPGARSQRSEETPSPETEISSSEWMMRKNFLAAEAAPAEEPAPSLYDLNDCTVEEQ